MSILFNGVVGFLFIFGDSRESISEETKRFPLVSDGFRLILGILAGMIGILKLFSPMETSKGSSIYILGDLVPALAGIIAGFMLIYGFYRSRSSKVSEGGSLDSFGEVLSHYKKIVGIVLLATVVLHFLFPMALFL
ncbi:MAG: hypothetical protein FWD36_03460 [Treponema sp.]|nr:hypothetical protein [Treponema sp.]